MIISKITVSLLAVLVFGISLVGFSNIPTVSALPNQSQCDASGGNWTNVDGGLCVCPDGTEPTEDTCVQVGCEDAGNGFLGFPTWYKYLDQQTVLDPTSSVDVCNAKLNGIQDIWLIVAAVIELMLRVATLVAIGFIIYGGVQYVISQGAPDKTKKSEQTVINAIVGLVISIVAAAIVSFVAGRF